MPRIVGPSKLLRNVFSESRRITDVAATEYDDLRDEQTQIEAHIAKLQTHIQDLKARGRGTAMKAAKSELKEAQNQRMRITDAQTALLQHPASWQPWKITAVERTTEGRQKGFDLFLKASSADAARGQVLLISYPY